ncbi:MAG: hypothetical protein ACRDAU_02890 [Clostridium sp.]
MANIQNEVNDILTALYGSQVREALANGLLAMNSEVNGFNSSLSGNLENLEKAQNEVESLIASTQESEESYSKLETSAQNIIKTLNGTFPIEGNAPSSMDCNNFIEPNESFLWNFGNGSFSNIPEVLLNSSEGIIVVKNIGNTVSGESSFIQILVQIAPTTNENIWFRSYSNEGTWGTWLKVITDEDVVLKKAEECTVSVPEASWGNGEISDYPVFAGAQADVSEESNIVFQGNEGNPLNIMIDGDIYSLNGQVPLGKSIENCNSVVNCSGNSDMCYYSKQLDGTIKVWGYQTCYFPTGNQSNLFNCWVTITLPVTANTENYVVIATPVDGMNSEQQWLKVGDQKTTGSFQVYVTSVVGFFWEAIINA